MFGIEIIENQLSLYQKKFEEAQRIANILRKTLLLKRKYDRLCEKNDSLYKELDLTPPTHLDIDEPQTNSESTPSPLSSPTTSTSSIEMVIERQEEENLINVKNFIDDNRKPDETCIKSQPLSDSDETDDLDTEEEDIGEPTEFWVDVGVEQRKCILDGKRLNTRVGYNPYDKNGKRSHIPAGTTIGHIEPLYDKNYEKLKVNNYPLHTLTIYQNAWSFVGDMKENNSILCPYYFDPTTEYIDKTKFKEQIKDGIPDGFQLHKQLYVNYPLEDHPLNKNINYSI